ncbi:MAG: MlaA family lipoprotein [Myxococcota bacterium]
MHRSLSLHGPLAVALLVCIPLLWVGPAAASGTEPPEDELEALLLEHEPLFEEPLHGATSDRDPWESCNRKVFGFNRTFDVWVFDPITRGYRLVVPKPGRRAIQRLVLNLDSPVILINQLLQLRLADSAGTLGRFVINSSFGIAGLFDPAGRSMGIARKEADFGQTMARYGMPAGPYVMLPIFGPSTARDAVGTVFDQTVDPLTYLLGPLQWWTLLIGGSEGLILREAALDELRALEEGSVDFYSALRSAYLQSRDAEVQAVSTDLVSSY